MLISDDEARAVREVAKVTGKTLDIVGGAGAALVNSSVGRIAEATLGLVGGDWVQEARARNLAKLRAKTARILDGVAQERLTEPSPSVVRPLLEAAADESREELQDLWAALLANAMLKGTQVRRDYFNAVRQMEPVDALVLDMIARRPNAHVGDFAAINADVQFVERERERLMISPDNMAIARQKLTALECISTPHTVPGLTPFGRGLLAACRVS